MKPSIIFVDDDPNVLNGLKRLLYPLRANWDMTFCTGGEQALKTMEKKPYDVIVTDLLMSGMSGDKLLEEVYKRHPKTIRIVLSGYANTELTLKTARIVHHSIAKPARSEELKSVIERMLELRGVVSNQKIQEIITQSDNLPILPRVRREILAELNAEEPALDKLADLISQDMGLSVTMIKLVNSAFFGLPIRVTSPAHAVHLLGLDIISGLVIGAHIFSCFDTAAFPNYDLEGLWRHCLRTGVLCKRLAGMEGMAADDQNKMYISGLLHDAGKIVLLGSSPELFREILEACDKKNIPPWAVEKERLSCTHADVGAYIFSIWGLPQDQVRCIGAHHEPESCIGDSTTNDLLKAAILHVANALDHELTVINPQYDHGRLNEKALELLGFANRLPEWRAEAILALEKLRESGEDVAKT